MFKISDVLERHHVIPGLNAPDKRALLEELARRAALALKIDENEIHAALQAREQLGSTGVGHGIAIPHARIAGLAQPFGLFVRLEPAIDFSAIDGQFVDLVFLLLTPGQASASHLSALAAISRRLRDAGTAGAVRGAKSAVEIFSALAGGAEKGVK
ncbi:MAG: PTS sugar transporter subunit IIA [Rhodospirillaceae bacterium]